MRLRSSYVTQFRIDGLDRFVWWESGDENPDRIVLDETGFVRTFASDIAAREAALADGRRLSTENSPLFDFDAVDAWCRSGDTVHDCSALLNAWNMLGDLPRDEKLFARADTRAKAIYDKLFFGCNLPSITPPGEQYVPTWTEPELALLRHVLQLGLAELRARLRSPS